MSGDSSNGGTGQNGGGDVPSSVTRDPAFTDGLDTDFEVLSDSRRRYLLYYLFSIDDDVTDLDAAVDAVCTYEAAGTGSDDRPSREIVRTELHHVHLPRLAEVGVLDYDPRQGTIRFDGRPSLEELTEHARYGEIDRETGNR